MKKICMLAAILMMMFFVTAVNVYARPGGLPDVNYDDSIKQCDCRLFPQCCDKPVPPPMKERVTIRLNVEFDTDKDIVKDKYYDDIKRVADFMKQYPDSVAAIEGNTDNVDTAEYNQKLSERRANSVRQYIIDKFGIDGSRLTAVGYGLSRPIASNDTEEGRQKNRRVDAVLEAIRIVK
jgi:outer membrane protein OmpA-like peptidoglycan-associated protein